MRNADTMREEKIVVETAIEFSPHRHAYINPYNGCGMGCPFCYWLNDPCWEHRIQIRTNICERLEQALAKWDTGERISIGSVCDPFCEHEKKYRLTRRCLQLLANYQIPVLITTSATENIVREYLPLLESMRDRITVVIELARIPYLQAMERGMLHPGIENANFLHENGIRTWATLAPILPGITDVEQVGQRLSPAIPLYMEELKCKEDSTQGKRLLALIAGEYPQLLGTYQELLSHGGREYFEKIWEKHKDRYFLKRFPFEHSEDERKP